MLSSALASAERVFDMLDKADEEGQGKPRIKLRKGYLIEGGKLREIADNHRCG